MLALLFLPLFQRERGNFLVCSAIISQKQSKAISGEGENFNSKT